VPGLAAVLEGLPLLLVLAAVAYRLCGLYEVHRLRELPRELGVICQASGLLFLLAITATFYAREPYESRLGLALFLAVNGVALALARRAVWNGLKWCRRHGLNYGRAVIVGTGRNGRLVSETIRQHAWTGLEAVGFVDRADRLEPAGLPRLGTIDELADVVARHDIDHVFVALPLSRYAELPAVYKALEKLLVEVQLVPDLPNLAGVRVGNVEIDGVTFLSLRADPHLGWSKLAKRSTDLVVGTAAIVLAAPLMLALAVVIKATSPGPVFYRQKRAGLKGRTFEMLKFRSMRVDAEQATGPVWARRGDERCTPLGRWLRRWSLDELPQLFNVLAGHMSLVGPRPPLLKEVEQYEPWQRRRLAVKPGLTCVWQVSGRNEVGFDDWVRMDLWYIDNQHLLTDLKLLARTPSIVLSRRGAY
jgi:exopolysaccharide biosynthesis polyprenyl glycosylphosphotransferase